MGPGGGGRRAGSASAVASRVGLWLCRRNDSPTPRERLLGAPLAPGAVAPSGAAGHLAVPGGLRGAERGLGGSRGFPKAGAPANWQPAGVLSRSREPWPRAGGHRVAGSPVPAGPVPAFGVPGTGETGFSGAFPRRSLPSRLEGAGGRQQRGPWTHWAICLFASFPFPCQRCLPLSSSWRSSSCCCSCTTGTQCAASSSAPAASSRPPASM